MSCELIPTCTPHLPVLRGAEKVKSGMKLSLGRRDGEREGVFNFVLISHFPIVIN